MTFSRRLLLAFLVVVLLPMVALALFIRSEMTERLTAQYERRVESLIRVIESDLAEESESVGRSLAVLGERTAEDNRFRRGVTGGGADDRRYVLDYAGEAMRPAGLSMLQIQDEEGRIVSSGHFRNDYDRLEPGLPRLLAAAEGPITLVRVRAPEAPFLALARVDSFRVGDRWFSVVGGTRVDERFLEGLTRDIDMKAALDFPGGAVTGSGAPGDSMSDPASGSAPDPADHSAAPDPATPGSRAGGEIVRELDVSFIDLEREGIERAAFRVTHDLSALGALRSSIDRWFIVAVAVAALVAVIVVAWLASRMSRPLAALAEKTARVDLDRLDIDFSTRRNDEIGVLSRGLGAMTERLRASAAAIKDAERRATVGELARQVNHDIKNGLTPIRNVFRHLAETARGEPGELAKIFREREATIDSAMTYLETLAGNYARLSVRGERRPCDVNEIVGRVLADRHGVGAVDREGSGAVRFHTSLCGRAVVTADPLSLRRILENLIDNAVDSLEASGGDVTVETAGAEGEDRIRVVVSDTGTGMTDDEMKKIFEDFYTTRPRGTGLGLSVVRRLIMDLDGSIRVESEKGKGSRFIIELPAAEAS